MHNRDEVKSKFLTLIQPFVRATNGSPITEQTRLIDDLKVNSARLVDIILETEDAFQISIDDTAADGLKTVGDAIDLILARAPAR